MRETFDVAVIGGGPAGAAVATFCRHGGLRCLVLEQGSYPRYHIGESLIPHTYGTLDRLGLLEKLRRSDYPEKHSVRFISPDGKEAEPFYFSETIDGPGSQTWQVERSSFDKMCLDHARENGVDVRMKARVKRVLFENSRALGISVERTGEQPYDVRARVVVDASGRGTVIGNQLGLKGPVAGLKKTSIWAYYKGGERLEGIDAGETTILMIPECGWFWYIPLPDDVVSVGLVASPEYLEGYGNYTEAFEREVEKCALLRARLVRARRTGKVRGIPKLAYRNRQTAGNGWVMIGDAAAFLDPIYSSGLFLALASAELAAGSIIAALEADDPSADRLGAHVGRLTGGVEVIRRLIHAFYDPDFGFGEFVRRFPKHRPALIDCLVGDVVDKNMDSFLDALARMTPVPEPLG